MSDQTEAAEPGEAGPPEPYYWNLAYDMMDKVGTEKATVIGLSMISEQLAYIIRKIDRDG
jgi:hypothetical protein